MLSIKIEESQNKKDKPQKGESLGFGKIFTDHMFVMSYNSQKGWSDAKITPFQNLSLSPACSALHYGQTMFEGMKAYRSKNDEIFIFRPEMNARRTNITNERLCIPQLPEDYFVDAVKAIVNIDKDWVPSGEGESLYIRPFIIGADEFLGVRPAQNYLFIIILSPSGAYYSSGLNPVGIWIEDEYVRAVKGGMGYAKTGGNYAASLKAQEKAHNDGFDQVLWLDGVERKYIEEVGAMNIFFKIGEQIVTPMLNGSILPGITRDSVISLCKHWGYEVIERKISVDELLEAQKNGELKECFGTGTAAVISPVGKLRFMNDIMQIGNGEIGELSQKIYDTLTGIQWGLTPDEFGWRVKI